MFVGQGWKGRGGGEIPNGFAPDLSQEGPELRFEPKTVYHFPLHLAEEKERGSGPAGQDRVCWEPSPGGLCVRAVRAPDAHRAPDGRERDRKGRFPASPGLCGSQAGPGISGRAAQSPLS